MPSRVSYRATESADAQAITIRVIEEVRHQDQQERPFKTAAEDTAFHLAPHLSSRSLCSRTFDARPSLELLHANEPLCTWTIAIRRHAPSGNFLKASHGS